MTLESAEQLSTTARSAINATGRRMTAQRATLLEIIQEAEDHLDADEIYRRARDRGENISLSTVYRTLSLLKRLKLVDELHLWDEHHHYESRTSQVHCHLLCQQCGGITEISGPVVERMRALIAEQHGFEVDRAQVDFVGTCASCRSGETEGQGDRETGRRGDDFGQEAQDR